MITALPCVNESEIRNLREITGNARNRRFRYEPYVRLFTDDTE